MSLIHRVIRLLSPPLLRVGDPAPAFHLQSWDGAWHRSTDGPYVLVFYPTDATPGCTAQLQEFSAAQATARAMGVSVFGVNPASLASHQAFAEAAGITVPLLHDDGGAVVRTHHCALPTGIGTRCIRTVYAVDALGTIRFAQRGAPPSSEVLAALSPGP